MTALPLTPNDEARRKCAEDLLWVQKKLQTLTKKSDLLVAFSLYGTALHTISAMLTRMDMDDIAHRIDCLISGED